MQCQHAIGGTASLVLCAFLDRMADRSKCETCPHFVAGQADPLPVPDLVSASPSPVDCVHRGDSLFDEPCSCGSSSRVAVHECRDPARSRRTTAYCVPLLRHWERVEDPIGKVAFKCCETCAHRTTSAAPSFRYESDDQHNPTSPPTE